MTMSEKRMSELLEKANTLPMCPGVYIMKDKNGKIVYVGKSRKLKNRVTQYFRNGQKSFKTAKMVNSVFDFEYILCKTEIEALTLENLLIKQHSPKYNIKLKDAKSYPYIKITSEEYPKIVFTRKRLADRSKYYGPFSGVSIVYSVLDIIHKSLGIPTCKRSFPRDIGKERPCIYYQMKQCCGLCTGNITKEEYHTLVKCAAEILNGNISASRSKLEQKMMEYADEENFEAAIRCRDTITALERLNQRQNVVASPDTDMDLFGLYLGDTISCISCMYVREGKVTDKKDYVIQGDAEIDSGALVAFLVEHYLQSEMIPRSIAISHEIDESDMEDVTSFLENRCGHKVAVKTPERGNVKQLLNTVISNAAEKVRQEELQAEKENAVLFELAKILQLESLPQRIEAYDISNIGTENITAGMVVFKDGKRSKADYRSFKIKTVVNTTDDYSSMKEAIKRRLVHLKEDTNGSFSEYPDLMLIDGGKGHVSVVKSVLREFGIDLAVFGMVKDDFHKTRALCTDTEEINIGKNKMIYNLIYGIQEEVHRFTVSKTMNAKRNTLKHSSLEKIKGIGPSKAQKILLHFGTLSAIKNASVDDISNVAGISISNAVEVYNYYHNGVDQ